MLEEGLSYPEDSAARIMQREFTAVPSDWSVGQTIDYLRESKDLPEEFLEIFVVDNEFKPIGIVPSSRVLRTPREKNEFNHERNACFNFCKYGQRRSWTCF